MMIAAKLARIERFLARKGIALQVTRRPPAEPGAIRRAEDALGRPLPADLRETYAQFADGFEVAWDDVRSNTDFDFGRFDLPDLETLVRNSLEFRAQTRGWLDNPEEYIDADGIDEAIPVLRHMLDWAVVWPYVGDADHVCIDLPSGAVVYHDYEWSSYKPFGFIDYKPFGFIDLPSGAAVHNGGLVATSWSELVDRWGDVCFLFFKDCSAQYPPGPDRDAPDARKYRLRDDEP